MLQSQLSKLAAIFYLYLPHAFVFSFIRPQHRNSPLESIFRAQASYLDELSLFRTGDKKCLIGLTTDAWNVGQRKYKEFLAVHRMAKKIQKNSVACVEIPLWEISQGPHYDELQRLLESFWIPDMTSTDNLLMQFDLIIVPDPVIAKYMVEAYFEKEAKVAKRKAYYNKLTRQPWGVIEHYPPRERYEYERIRDLGKQKYGVRKFPPIAVCGDEAYKRIKPFGQVDYFSYNVEDFALYLTPNLVPTRRVLLLRFKNRYDTLAQSLVLRGINVTSAYPVTWMKKHWSPQEDRLAKEIDVVYFHEGHAVKEWGERMQYLSRANQGIVPAPAGTSAGTGGAFSGFMSGGLGGATATLFGSPVLPNNNVPVGRDSSHVPVAACHDEAVARAAKAAGFVDVFYAKKRDTEGLTKTVLQAVDHVRMLTLEKAGKKPSTA